MDQREVIALVELLRRRATDLTGVEAKAARGGLPKSARESLSAFSNDSGGTLILGLDERAGFAIVSDLDPIRIRDALAAACADEMEPPVRADIEIVDLDEGPLVVADIPELDPRFKPCYVKARGEYNGSYTRGGDGDRRLTDFEIHLLHTNRGQPEDDRDPVPGATIDDLNADDVAYLLRRVRQRQRRAFGDLDDLAALRRLNVVVLDQNDRPIPTLAGLLALGDYPQQFFPQLNITFVVYPGLAAGDQIEGGPRFLDNRAFDGPIPVMVEEAVAAVTRNMAVRSFIEGVGRRDVFDYPVEAVREAIVNAVVHRDYSPYSRGAAVQVVMYADRLVVANPGGLFGAVTEDDLGSEGVCSSRNPVLVKLLQDVRLPNSDRTVCENRGSGIPAMLREMRRTGSTLPEFHNRITRFKVIFPKHTLLDGETMRWLGQLGAEGLTPTQHMALALMRSGKHVSNQTLRNLGLDGRRATTELCDLVNRGLAVRVGERRHARYLLSSSVRESEMPPVPGPTAAEPAHNPLLTPPAATIKSAHPAAPEDQIFEALPAETYLTRREIERRTGLPRMAVLRALNALIEAGRVEPRGSHTAPNRGYRRLTTKSGLAE